MSDSAPKSTETWSDERIKRYVSILGLIAVVLAVWGIASRVVARNALERAAAKAAVTTVITIKPTRGAMTDTLVLPGSVQAYYEAPIYARTSGYLKAWYKDIGTPVKKGDLLAEIETPEVDQQLRQARADLATAQANYELARTTNDRWQGLLATQSVSQQDADSRAGDAAAKLAAQQSAAANVARLNELESFKRVVAPFDGIVTQRNTDIGALINAGQNPGSALFRVADTHRLRIYTSVPQLNASAVRVGGKADLVFADHPGKVFPATVAFTAQALDATTRTLQVELQIDNAKSELFPGSYAEVHFALPSNPAILHLPSNTLIFRAEGLLVATVEGDHIKLKPITQGRDFGREVEVLSGVNPDDDIVINPPDSIADGVLVRRAEAPPKAAISSKRS